MRKKYKIWKNPFRWYRNVLRNSIEPTDPTHRINMYVEIQKGKTEGRDLIPCAIYTMDHQIDVNPSLIRKKDKKFLKKLPLNKKIEYDSKKYDVILTKDEKNKGYVLTELERCKHCGSRIVIAEVAETRYRSCPDVKVRVSDPAKDNLIIPVHFGVRRGQILFGMMFPFIFDVVLIWGALTLLYPNINVLGTWFHNGLAVIGGVNKIPLYIIAALMFLFFAHITILIHYKGFKLFKWYSKVKPTLKEVKGEK